MNSKQIKASFQIDGGAYMIENNLKKDRKAVPVNTEALKNISFNNTFMKRLMNSAEQQLIGKK